MNSKLILNNKTTFGDAVKMLDNNGNGVLAVVDESNKLLGLITDGDIRKAILKKHLDLLHIINMNPHTLSAEFSDLQCIQYLKKIKRRNIPLIDAEGKFVRMFTLDKIEFNEKQNTIVIMAGGLGTRLGKLTENTPKPMLHVGNKPILEVIIEKFITFGFYKFIISVNYKKEIIKEYFGDGSKWGIEISYLEENKRLGTGGALSLIQEELKEPIIITNGDVLTNIDFEQLLNFHLMKESVATMCIREYEHIIQYGVIEVSGDKIKALSEKPKVKFNINTGIYVLNPSLLNRIPVNEYFDLPSLFQNLINDNIIPHYYNAIDYWIDIGQKEDYMKANNDVMEENDI